MDVIGQNLLKIKQSLRKDVALVAVSKTKPVSEILKAYDAGQRIFGENRVQELVAKYDSMPKDIQWHLIGHLQSNKVKHIAPFVSLIHSVDTESLLMEINKQGEKNNRIINCLLQIYIAQENTKFGFDFEEAKQLLLDDKIHQLKHVRLIGLMGMATNTNNKEQVKKEFRNLKGFFDELKQISALKKQFSTLSMGMSSDYQVAIEEGSNMIRVGSNIFGYRE